jgi:hydrogenase-1 operon protein HyaF
MTRLSDIGVRIEAASPVVPKPPPGGHGVERTAGLGGGVAAILAELAARLERLATHGDPALIDLRSLPMSPVDRIELFELLGQGEVTATLDAQGASTLRETAFAGIWWIDHRDREEKITAELLEVALVPKILATSPADVALAAAALRQRIGAADSRAPGALGAT